MGNPKGGEIVADNHEFSVRLYFSPAELLEDDESDDLADEELEYEDTVPQACRHLNSTTWRTAREIFLDDTCFPPSLVTELKEKIDPFKKLKTNWVLSI